jgi:cytochrome c peroxidase
MRAKVIILSFLALIAVTISCKKEELQGDTSRATETPNLPATVDDYTASQNDDKAVLGRVLFYDKKMSLNNSTSCGSCHRQDKAFCDNQQFSTGLDGRKTGRNTPSIFARQGRLFWDGRASGINDVVLKPVQNHVEMNFSDLNSLAQKLSNTSYYPDLFEKAFGTRVISESNIREALGEFVRNFNFSKNSFKMGVLNAQQSFGKGIFMGKGKCSECHHVDTTQFGNGYGFTDFSKNIGLDDVYADNGIGTLNSDSKMNGNFMVPVLLNVAMTAPYMHDGRFKTLEEVVEHYNSGIKNHPSLSATLRDLSSVSGMSNEQIFTQFDKDHNGFISDDEFASLPPVKLNLTTDEKKALVAFLQSLTDPAVFTDRRFSDPFLK